MVGTRNPSRRYIPSSFRVENTLQQKNYIHPQVRSGIFCTNQKQSSSTAVASQINLPATKNITSRAMRVYLFCSSEIVCAFFLGAGDQHFPPQRRTARPQHEGKGACDRRSFSRVWQIASEGKKAAGRSFVGAISTLSAEGLTTRRSTCVLSAARASRRCVRRLLSSVSKTPPGLG